MRSPTTSRAFWTPWSDWRRDSVIVIGNLSRRADLNYIVLYEAQTWQAADLLFLQGRTNPPCGFQWLNVFSDPVHNTVDKDGDVKHECDRATAAINATTICPLCCRTRLASSAPVLPVGPAVGGGNWIRRRKGVFEAFVEITLQRTFALSGRLDFHRLHCWGFL
ncbi:hypothetical protein ACVIEM_007524 [Rhizobium leguminosarum]